AADVALRRAPEALDTIRGRGRWRERLEPDDLLTDAEDVPRAQGRRLVATQLLVNALERALVAHVELAVARGEVSWAGREVAVACEDGAETAAHRHDAHRQRVRSRLGAVGAQRGEHDAARLRRTRCRSRRRLLCRRRGGTPELEAARRAELVVGR